MTTPGSFPPAGEPSRDFLATKRRAENQVLMPAGPKIAFTGGLDFNNHRLIWDKLDKVHAKHPDMVLLHGGSPIRERCARFMQEGCVMPEAS